MVQVDVTDYDISHGSRCNCFSCPIALATNRVLKEGYYSSIDLWVEIIGPDGNSVYKEHPSEEVEEFINYFDIGQIKDYNVREFTFEIPSRYLR